MQFSSIKLFVFAQTFLSIFAFGALSKTQVSGLKAADEVVFKHDFPRSKQFGSLVIDEKAVVRINMTNNSPLPKTVFGITAYYTNVEDASKDQVKIGHDKVQILVKAGKTVHLKYKFIPQANSGSRGLLIVVDYYDSEEPAYKSVGALQVIQLVYGDSLFDLQSISIYTLLTGIVIWVGYYLVSPSATPSSATGKEKAPRAPKVVAPKKELTEADLDLDWIPAHIKDIEKKSGKGKKQKK